MGGWGSTRWSGHVRRRTIGEAASVLRVREAVAAYRDQLANTTAAEEPGAVHLWIDAPVSTSVALEATPQPAGGVRWWLQCPRCSARRTALYQVPSGAFGCRGCLRLVYLSQRLDPVAGCQHRQRQIARRLGDLPSGGFPDLPAKPPRMHWSTYDRLADQFEAVDARWLRLATSALHVCAARISGRHR